MFSHFHQNVATPALAIQQPVPVLPHFGTFFKRCVATSHSVARNSAKMNKTKTKKIKCVSSPVLSSTLVFHPLSRVEKKGEKGQSNKKGQQMEGGGEPELSHVTSVDRLTGTPPRAHTQKGEKTFDDSILLCRLSSFLLKTQKNVLRPFQLFLFKRNQIFTFFKKEIK